MNAIAFEWTFRAGDVLTFIGGIVVAAAFLYRRGGADAQLGFNAKSLSEKLDAMQSEIKKMNELITTVAVQSTRLNSLTDRLNTLDNRYDDLRRGDGFIRGVRGLDKEYK